MSRHHLTPSQSRIRDIIVGWDRPLRTFFIQAHGWAGAMLVWKGCSYEEVPTADAAIAILASIAVVPDGFRDLLAREQAATAGEEDGPAQRAVRGLL